jgi:Beta-lactamase enzyme family
MVHSSDGWNVNFIRSNKTIKDLAGLHAQLEHADVPTGLALLDQLGFLDRMKLAIGWSDNIAAATCVRDVGYPYMAALAFQSGLYEYDEQARNGPGGLWLGGDYTKGAVAGPWKVSPVGKFPSAGTAKALATFMTLLARDRLVDPKASAEMRDLMDHLKIRAELLKGVPKGQTVDVPGSFFFQGLRHLVDLKAVYQKVGVVDVEHEAALIEVDGLDEPLPRRYVLVALGAVYRKDGESLLAEVAAYIDRSLQSWLTTAPQP